VYRSYRGLFKRPGFFLIVLLTLMLGIGANSAIFSVIDAVLLKPLPYPNGDRLMAIYESNPRQQREREHLAPARVEEWNRLNHSFTGISGAYIENIAEVSGPLPEKLVCARVAPRFFSVLATPPLAGRGFTADEDQVNGPSAAVISERFWTRRFNRAPNALGKVLRVGTRGYAIVGIVPGSFTFPYADVDVWMPAQFPPLVTKSREGRFYISVGRLKDGVDRASAQADLAAVQGQLALQYPATDANWSALVEPLKEQTVGGVRRSLWILFGAVSLVLLIACANVACLMLAEGNRRAREIAVRFSLGARRGQVIAELLLESFCLALPGGMLGLLLAIWGASLFQKTSANLPRAAEIHADWRIALFTLVLCVLTTVLFGLFPAIAATRRDAAAVLALGSRTQAGGGQSLQRILVSTQIALAIVLLVGAGLMIRTLSRLGQVTLGFDPAGVLSLRTSASWGELNNPGRVQERLFRTLEVLRSIPGVQFSAVSIGLPGGDEYSLEFHIAGRDSGGEKLFANIQTVSPDYFRVLGIPLLAGETCRVDPNMNSALKAIVNRTFAERFFPAQSPLGQHVRYGGYPNAMEIIGVASDVREYGYAKDPKPTIYGCGMPSYFPDPHFLLKAAGDPMALSESIRRELSAIEPNRAVYGVTRLSDHLSSTLSEKRLQTRLLSAFGATALLLAAIGLYGVTSFAVSQRTREIGVRMALGARPSQSLGQIFRGVALMAGAGTVIGLLAATLLTRSIATLLFGVAPLDPITFAAVPAVLGTVAVFAVLAPARRAARVDPMVALRQE
jgi:putative ABC transport system permease protein